MRKNGKDQKSSPKEAVSLRYNPPEDNAPVVTASGKGWIAEKIVSIAERHGVPIEKNEALTAALIKLNIGDEIPPELYETVAVLINYVLKIDQKFSS